MNSRVAGFVTLLMLSFVNQVKASPIYGFGIGNTAPSTIYYVQGQSFTPSVAGNAGTPSYIGFDASVWLTRFTIAFPSNLTPNPPSTLYIYSFAPTIAQVNNGQGSLGVGTYLGGGTYAFQNLQLSYYSTYFAILPESVSVFDGSGNPYPGGVDVFPWNGRVQEGNGQYDIGFNAEFSARAPEPSSFVLLCLSGLTVVGFRPVRRGHLALL